MFHSEFSAAKQSGGDGARRDLAGCGRNSGRAVRREPRQRIHRLVEVLYKRRHMIRRLVSIFRESTRNPFPNWRDRPTSINFAAAGREEGTEIR